MATVVILCYMLLARIDAFLPTAVHLGRWPWRLAAWCHPTSTHMHACCNPTHKHQSRLHAGHVAPHLPTLGRAGGYTPAGASNALAAASAVGCRTTCPVKHTHTTDGNSASAPLFCSDPSMLPATRACIPSFYAAATHAFIVVCARQPLLCAAWRRPPNPPTPPPLLMTPAHAKHHNLTAAASTLLLRYCTARSYVSGDTSRSQRLHCKVL
jgi:hypothetical protein